MDSRQKRFVMNMQLRKYVSRVKASRPKKAIKIQILSGFFRFSKFFDFQKKPSALTKAGISKSGFKKTNWQQLKTKQGLL